MQWTGTSGGGMLLPIGSGKFRFYTVAGGIGAETYTSVMDFDGANVGIGTASPGSFGAGARNLVVGDTALGSTGLSVISGSASYGTINFGRGTGGLAARGWVQYEHSTDKLFLGASGATNVAVTSTLLDASIVSGYGLKLPATPGNADTQTLDAYREDTFTTSFSGLGNCSNVSASNLRFTQIGRLVTIEGTFTFTVTAATTQTNFNFTLPSGRNRGSTANAGCGIGVDNASTFTGAIWNASGDATTAAIYFGPTNPFGAGTVRTVPFSYSYYTAT